MHHQFSKWCSKNECLEGKVKVVVLVESSPENGEEEQFKEKTGESGEIYVINKQTAI